MEGCNLVTKGTPYLTLMLLYKMLSDPSRHIDMIPNDDHRRQATDVHVPIDAFRADVVLPLPLHL